ncbi:anti-sigma factor [Streptomyces sp. NPDC048441]|uniref:anti-sigma factor n=1 Tax=Streptomyces sp. NPDC048441 TaxID=3365552 RepID=UPI0037104E0E
MPRAAAPTGRELRRFERHLARCTRCRAETRGLAEDAVRLAAATAAAPPPALRERILTAVRTTEQEPLPQAPVTSSAPPRARVLLVAVTVPAAALALAASAILAVQLIRTDDRLDQERANAREMTHVLAAPDARATGDRDARGRGINIVASESRRRAVVTVTGLGGPPQGRVHQLWLLRPASGPRSLGLLKGETPVIVAGLSASASSLAVTTEPGGGSKRPTSAPLVQLALESVVFGE